MDKVVVAIHGIGSQRRGDSIRSVAQRFGAYWEPPLPVMPLGYFHVGRGTEVHVSELETDPNHPAAAIGFAEVFWADIPRGVAASEDTLEETKAWGASVVSRARATYLRNVAQPKLAGADFDLGAGVIEEIVETLDVMENLLVVADKAGVFKFEIGQLLRDYIGDVQVVTEFKLYRDMILYRFHAAMAKIVDRFDPIGPDKNCEIYLVAHSEGSVVSFLAMLQALSAGRILDPEGKLPPIDTGWIRHVRGFMTIGSPIDKHIVLWPKLWDGLRFARQLEQPIKWRNYYDFGDPIGFKLDAARDFLGEKGCKAFDFEAKHDLSLIHI